MPNHDTRRSSEDVSQDELLSISLRKCSGFLRHHAGGRGSQRRVLLFLSERGPITQSEILEEMEVKASSLSELLGKLEARGFVLKEKSEADKRNFNVSITQAGLDALQEMQVEHEKQISDLMSVLEPDEKTQLLALLEKLHRLWRQRADAPPERRSGHGYGHSRELF